MVKKLSWFLLALTLTAAACSKKGGQGGGVIEKGSTVKIHYTLTVDGAVADSSGGREPLSFVQGSGQIIPGLEEELSGLRTGDKKKITVDAAKGYGQRNDQALQKVPKTAFGDTKSLKVGDVVSGQGQGGRQFQAIVTAIEDKEITLDFNHPLAGKTLNFEVEVMEVQTPKPL